MAKSWQVVLSFLCASLVSAGVIPSLGSESIPKLFLTSSLVFKGEVTSVVELREMNTFWHGQNVRSKKFAAIARVDRPYKGEISSGQVTVKYSRPVGNTCTVSPCTSLSVGEYALFFLKTSGDRYELDDLFFGKFNVSRLNAPELRQGLDGIESDLLAGLNDPDETKVLQSVELLGAMEHLSSTSSLQKLLSSANTKIKAAIYAALLRLRDYTKLEETGRFLELANGDPTVLMLKDRMSFYLSEIRDRKTVAVLIRLAHSSSDLLRQDSIHALREIASQQSVPTFISALDDSVVLIRYDAVLGLASIERNWDLAPSLETFKHSEPRYIQAWKSWWVQTGKAEYGSRMD